MKIEKLMKLESVKEIFDKNGIAYVELKNGQLQVDKINFWATTEKWYDPIRNVKGVGLNSFIKHLRDNRII